MGRMEFLFPMLGVTLGVVIGLLLSPRRFSLRTLLIATTLVAVVLGLIVWEVR
jgi:disulfide bond formation protein DsbB